jgi:hypothetical protein
MHMRYIDTSYIQPISKKDAQKEREKKNYEEGMLNEHTQIHLTLNKHRYTQLQVKLQIPVPIP